MLSIMRKIKYFDSKMWNWLGYKLLIPAASGLILNRLKQETVRKWFVGEVNLQDVELWGGEGGLFHLSPLFFCFKVAAEQTN